MVNGFARSRHEAEAYDTSLKKKQALGFNGECAQW